MLAAMGGEVVQPELASAALHDLDPRVREEAVRALSANLTEVTITILGEALRDPDAEVRAGSLAALGEIDSPSAIRVLRGAMAEPVSAREALAVAEVLADR